MLTDAGIGTPDLIRDEQGLDSRSRSPPQTFPDWLDWRDRVLTTFRTLAGVRVACRSPARSCRYGCRVPEADTQSHHLCDTPLLDLHLFVNCVRAVHTLTSLESFMCTGLGFDYS